MLISLGRFEVTIKRELHLIDREGNRCMSLGEEVEKHEEIHNLADLKQVVLEEQANCIYDTVVTDININLFDIDNCDGSYSFYIGTRREGVSNDVEEAVSVCLSRVTLRR